MKHIFSIFIIALVILAASCSDDNSTNIPGLKDTIKAEIGSRHWVSTSNHFEVFITNNVKTIKIWGQNGDETIAISIVMPSNKQVATGDFELPSSVNLIAYSATYTKGSKIYTATTGTLSIIDVTNTVPIIIKGKFNFTASDGSDTFVIKEGEFETETESE